MNNKIKFFLKVILTLILFISLQTLLYYVTNNINFVLNIEQSYPVIYSIFSFIYTILTGVGTIAIVFGNPWNPWD